MGTVASLIENVRYDLMDYEKGLDFDDRLLYVYLNRMIKLLDSQLAALGSDLVFAVETDIDTVADQNYIDLTYMNNGQWDSVLEVWIGTDLKTKISIQNMLYKRKWYSSSQEPQFWCLDGRRILWEADADSAHTDVVIHYNKKHRPRLASWTDTFTADDTTEFITLAAGVHTFVTGDGPFRVSNTGGGLPAGLATATDYWCILDPDQPTKMQLASSKMNALAGTEIDITSTGSGTHTITLNGDVIPYDGIFDDLIREMVVLHATLKLLKQPGQAEMIYEAAFKKRAMEETIRRGFVPLRYSKDF